MSVTGLLTSRAVDHRWEEGHVPPTLHAWYSAVSGHAEWFVNGPALFLLI